VSSRPIVIAHRGASGYLPEHTLAGKALAYGLGADFLEQDVVASRDGELVVLHDLYLDDVTDVAVRFPGRSRQDGRHYVIDFELTELRELAVYERRKPGTTAVRYPQRFPAGVGILRIASLAEELELVRGLNRSMRRSVGVYPEIKHPAWHREHGVDVAEKLLATLSSFGYSRREDPAFVQCFDPAELVRVRRDLGSELRLIQLVAPGPEYEELLGPPGLTRLAQHAFGLGPHYSQLVEASPDGSPQMTDLARRAKAAGLALHPYTFRADDLPPYARTLGELIEFFAVEGGVDGFFCDHPDLAVRALQSAAKVR
jgi:glycerophosphoryl diester phosphodiesterase